MEEIAEAIKKLKPKLSTEADSIPSFIINGCGEWFLPVLKHVFNLSLTSGVFPPFWKNAMSVLIFKSGDAFVTNNNRPISLLHGFSKMFELVFHNRIHFYFRQIFLSCEYVFLIGRSVETNLCALLNFCALVVMNKGEIDCIYFDI
ncbi:hypothetical protein ANAPC5_01201 [Anaplasma phagocytophilum]|nr:hypothetical protein ANAPC5_01201 [Anaplasma phagocytophilum]